MPATEGIKKPQERPLLRLIRKYKQAKPAYQETHSICN